MTSTPPVRRRRGQCYGYIGFRAMKFNEANQRYLTEVHYTYHLQPLVISERVSKN